MFFKDRGEYEKFILFDIDMTYNTMKQIDKRHLQTLNATTFIRCVKQSAFAKTLEKILQENRDNQGLEFEAEV